MPDYISIIDNRRNQIGMTIRALARKVNMSDDLLSRTLTGKRKMTASEFIMLSYGLGLALEDYPIEAERAV